MSTLGKLKRRKIVQWSLAYLAGAWVLVEVASHLAVTWGFSEILIRGLHVVLAFGFLVTLILAWYHGEQGRQRVSGPELLMLTVAFLVAGAVVTMLDRDAGAEGVEPRLPESGADALDEDPVSSRSVAVLPLEDHSADPRYAYFADAMSAEISTALEKVPELVVKSYASARRFQDSELTPREFAAEIGVAHLLEGSVQREGDRIRITARLVDARSGEQLWTKVYDRQGVIEAIDVQVDIARQVADQLATEFSRQEFERIEAGSTDDPVAYEEYLQSTRYDRSSPEELDQGIARLRRAVERDPEYAIAWAALGGSFDWKLQMSGEARWRDSTLRAFRRAAAEAEGTALENNLRATVALLEGRPDEATSLLREEAVANPGSVIATRDLAGAFYFSGEYDEAVLWMGRYVDLHPLDHVGWAILGDIYSKLGLDRRAVHAFRRSIDVADPTTTYAWLPWAWYVAHAIRADDIAWARALADSLRVHRRGDALGVEAFLAILDEDLERARDLLRSTEGNEPRDLAYLAHVERRLGDSVVARGTLAKAREKTTASSAFFSGYGRLVTTAVAAGPEQVASALATYVDAGGRDARWIRRDPVFDRVRDDPAFEAELARLDEILARQRDRVERVLAQSE